MNQATKINDIKTGESKDGEAGTISLKQKQESYRGISKASRLSLGLTFVSLTKGKGCGTYLPGLILALHSPAL